MKTTSPFTRLLLAAMLALAIVAGTVRPSEAFLDKTRFVAHLGVAYFCFHHWVLRPYEAGSYASGAPHRFSTIVKGGAALLFAVHEVRVAQRIAEKSNDPLLQKLDGGLTDLTSSFGTVGQKLKSGNFSADDVRALESQTNIFGSRSAAAGAPVKDVPVAVPGA
jgi:hypothetical protein